MLSGDPSDYYSSERGGQGSGILRLEVRDAAELSVMPMTTPHNKNLSSPKYAMGENP